VSSDKLINTISMPAYAVTNGPKHHFFGYYDKSPWDISGRFMLAMEVDFMDHFPKPDETAGIGIIDLMDNSFKLLAKTKAWNWQQGAMLQWIPSLGDTIIAFNDRDQDNFIGVILDTKSGNRRLLERPIYAISPFGDYALSLNFSRLIHKAYGYSGVPDPWYDHPCPENDGIYLMDLETGKYELVISLAELATFYKAESLESLKHWVNHLVISPDGTRFAFFHRWQMPDGTTKTRLFTANPDGSNLRCLLNSGMASHFSWRNNHQILAWARKKKTVSSLQRSNIIGRSRLSKILGYIRKKGIPGWVRKQVLGDGYLLLDDQLMHVDVIGQNVLTENGHPSFSPNGNCMVTDTGPNEHYHQTLILYHWKSGTRFNIGSYKTQPDIYMKDGCRCDLHPRWSRDGRYICFDSTHEGERQMYIVKVDEITTSY